MTRTQFDAMVYTDRRNNERQWPHMPRFPDYEYQVPILIDLVVQLFDRIEKLETPK